MKKIIAIAKQKGGVGKTTTTFNLAAGLVRQGKKVLMIDLDPQANLSKYAGYERGGAPNITGLMVAVVNGKSPDIASAIQHNAEGMDYIPSGIQLSGADLFLAQAMCRERVLSNVLNDESLRDYEYILIDCLPTLGVLLVNALTAANSLLIPVQAQLFALEGLDQLMQVFKLVKSNTNPHLAIEGVLLTMTDNTNMAAAVAQSLKEQFGSLLFKTYISKSVAATNSTYEQKSLPQLGGKLGEQYTTLTAKLLRGSRHED